MESVALHRRGNLAPSASALATESARPLADRLIKSPKPLMKKQAVKRHHHKHNLRHRYEFLETLGKGTYGKVKKARESSGRLVAIKSIRKDKIKDEQDLLHIRREIEIMSSLNHPHIIAIHEVFENSSKIVIVMEYASRGDLYDYISERPRLNERDARHFFRQIVSALHYCHQVSGHPPALLVFFLGGRVWGSETGTQRKASGLSDRGMLVPLALLS